MDKKINFVLAGEGGQGIQTMAKILSVSAVEGGMEATYMPSFGVEQRGTPSVAFLSISQHPLRYPKFQVADYIVVLQARALKSIEQYAYPNSKIIFDSSTISEKDLFKTSIHLYGIPATKYAYEKFTPKSFNIILIGAISKILNIPEDIVWENIKKSIGKKFKNNEVVNANHEALIFGREIVFERKEFTKAEFKTGNRKILVKGYEKHGEIVPARCKGCGVCLVNCPVAALSFSEILGVYGTPVPRVNLERCIACGNCRNFCPDGAISINKD